MSGQPTTFPKRRTMTMKNISKTCTSTHADVRDNSQTRRTTPVPQGNSSTIHLGSSSVSPLAAIFLLLVMGEQVPAADQAVAAHSQASAPTKPAESCKPP